MPLDQFLGLTGARYALDNKIDQFHQNLVVNIDFSENKPPQKKIKNVTMDKTLWGKGVL